MCCMSADVNNVCFQMPLIKRSVEPRNVSRGHGITDGAMSVQDELELVSVTTLSNVMRQLSSLSVRVDDMFGELNRESVAISRRMIALTERTERLRMKIMQLNPTVEPGHYSSCHLRALCSSNTNINNNNNTTTTNNNNRMPLAVMKCKCLYCRFQCGTVQTLCSYSWTLIECSILVCR